MNGHVILVSAWRKRSVSRCRCVFDLAVAGAHPWLLERCIDGWEVKEISVGDGSSLLWIPQKFILVFFLSLSSRLHMKTVFTSWIETLFTHYFAGEKPRDVLTALAPPCLYGFWFLQRFKSTYWSGCCWLSGLCWSREVFHHEMRYRPETVPPEGKWEDADM